MLIKDYLEKLDDDIYMQGGHAALAIRETNKKEEYPLNVIFSHDLDQNFQPPDELIQGILTTGDSSILYGDSNSGKTFLAIDMACAVARGIDWMGQKTEKGLVLYLAAESPASVCSRLQAYQKHHCCKVPNFAVVKSPVNLFDSELDTERVIELIGMIETKYDQKVRLIVGDTLSRISAGANENIGQDMGIVVQRIDRIRSECSAHFMMIHHSGKVSTAGARGWSGIRAAVDTEIHVVETVQGRYLEITKQRDLSTKGNRIGFSLESMTLGVTKWGIPATSCVVLKSEIPTRIDKVDRLGNTQQAIIEMLNNEIRSFSKIEITTTLLAKGINKRSTHNALNRLLDSKIIDVTNGMVYLIDSAP